MKVSAKLNNIRIAPRKTRLVANLIKGLDVKDALVQLDLTVKRTSLPMKKLLESAIANGENNFGVDRDNMYVLDVVTNAGATLKRWMPKAYGRAGQILKRTSQIELILEERVEGQGRKTKEELAEEKAKRLEAKKKIAKEMETKQEGKEETKKEPAFAKGTEAKEGKKAEAKAGKWGTKIFQRKSM